MTNDLHLAPRHRGLVEDLARQHLPGVEVCAYGSRVNGQSHDGSDLDLVLRGPNLTEIDATRLSDFEEGLRDSTLPFLVEARDWARLPDRFHAEIERRHTVLVPAQSPWRDTTLGDCASLVRDSVSPSQCGDVPYVGLEHIGQGTLSLVGSGRAGDVESTKTAFRAGDILFGKLRPYFRKVVRPRFDGICSTDIWVVRPQAGVDAGYLFYLLASSAFVSVASQGAGGTRMPRAKWEHVSGFSFRLPPLAEQRAIAGVLGALDDKIALNRRIAGTLQETVRTLFKSWFVDFDPVRPMGGDDPACLAGLTGLFPSRLVASDVGEIPAGWSVRPLGELMELAYGRALRADERRDGGTPVFGSNGQVGWHDTGLVSGPGVIVGRKGNPGTVTWSQRGFFPIDTTFYVVPKDGQSLHFLFFALRLQNLPSLAADSAVPGLNRNFVYKSRQVVPSAEVIEAFARRADAALSGISHVEGESRTLAELRDALLPMLMSGNIGTRDAEKAAERAT